MAGNPSHWRCGGGGWSTVGCDWRIKMRLKKKNKDFNKTNTNTILNTFLYFYLTKKIKVQHLPALPYPTLPYHTLPYPYLLAMPQAGKGTDTNTMQYNTLQCIAMQCVMHCNALQCNVMQCNQCMQFIASLIALRRRCCNKSSATICTANCVQCAMNIALRKKYNACCIVKRQLKRRYRKNLLALFWTNAGRVFCLKNTIVKSRSETRIWLPTHPPPLKIATIHSNYE